MPDRPTQAGENKLKVKYLTFFPTQARGDPSCTPHTCTPGGSGGHHRGTASAVAGAGGSVPHPHQPALLLLMSPLVDCSCESVIHAAQQVGGVSRGGVIHAAQQVCVCVVVGGGYMLLSMCVCMGGRGEVIHAAQQVWVGVGGEGR